MTYPIAVAPDVAGVGALGRHPKTHCANQTANVADTVRVARFQTEIPSTCFVKRDSTPMSPLPNAISNATTRR
jgi:hypothetical protein